MASYVIIGAGVAGTTAADTLRKLDPDAEITLIGHEVHPLYSRVLLSHYVEGKIERDRLFLKKPEWYLENNIVYMSGIDVLEVDTKNSFVRTSEEREIPYDKLLITSGSEVRLALDNMRGISYFRTLEDAEQMIGCINSVLTQPIHERRAIVAGGGFVALEYINILAHFKIPTTVILRSTGFWSRSFGVEAQKILQRHVEKQGVQLLTNQSTFEFLGTEDFAGVRLLDGTKIKAQMIGMAIGMVPEVDFLKSSGIKINKGILANEYLETNIENVYTAGDVAEFYDAIVERQFVMGNWTNAQMQARAAATSMADGRTKFELVTSYSANLLGKDIVFVGDVSREHADDIIQKRVDEENSTEIFVRDGRMVGAVLVGEVKERTKLTNAIRERQTYRLEVKG
ncbi:MAG: FAD-dependent oxidoreductase [Patescibacteria group bacterium]|nr:FAD-dependent oxidoreductase [Patescibacteria group bacterium]